MFIGDSKTLGSPYNLDTGGFQTPLVDYLGGAGAGVYNVGALAAGSKTVAATLADFPAFAAAYSGDDPHYVLVNLGTNDMSDIRLGTLTEGAWVMDDLLDAIHAEWPSAQIRLTRPIRTDYVPEMTALNDTWIPNVLASRSAWAAVGADEREFLIGANIGDTTHPTPAGYIVEGRWMGWNLMGIHP